jgi:hypothetical protein
MKRTLRLTIVCGWVILGIGSEQAVGQTDVDGIILSGRVHRTVMLVEDGASLNGFFMDSEQAVSMLRADASRRSDGDWTVSGALEVGIQSNPPILVSQDNRNPGTDLTVRYAEFALEHAQYGKMRLGRVVAAAWVVSEYDLSGTVPSATLAPGMLAPGMKFVDQSTNELSDFRVLDYFFAGERLLLTDGIRYDSPRFWGGGQLSGTYAAEERWDAAFRYYPAFDEWSLRVAATYQHKPLPEIEHRADLGLSVRHEGTGLSLTGALVRGRTRSGRDATGHVLKAGWIIKVVALGATALSIDCGRTNDTMLAGDRAESIGLFAQQNWDSVQVVFYAGYRTYEVTRPDISLRRLHTLTTGAMLTF